MSLIPKEDFMMQLLKTKSHILTEFPNKLIQIIMQRLSKHMKMPNKKFNSNNQNLFMEILKLKKVYKNTELSVKQK